MTPLVSTEWLAANLHEVRVVDASWYMPDEKRDPAREFETIGHIPGAGFFDIEALSDKGVDLPHMLPSRVHFEAGMAALGIGNQTRIVVYDGAGLFSAPRAWWMLRVMGHENVTVLDGGFPKWKSEGRPVETGVETGAVRISPNVFHAQPNSAILRDFSQVKAALGTTQILDARSRGRFSGAEAEPRAGIKGGHMPGAINVPFRSLLTPDNCLKDDVALAGLFAEKKVDLDAPVITTCGSGITAAIVMLALEKIGASQVALYDGSWTEWGGRSDAPIEIGDAAIGDVETGVGA